MDTERDLGLGKGIGNLFDFLTESFREMDKEGVEKLWDDLTLEEKVEAMEVYAIHKEEVLEDCEPTWVPGVYIEKGVQNGDSDYGNGNGTASPAG